MCRMLIIGMVLVATVFLLCGTSVAGLTNFIDVTDDWGLGGATGNGSTDDTDAIREAVNVAYWVHGSNSTVFFPATSGSYRVTDTITIPSNLSVVMESPMLYDGEDDEPCLVIGSSSTVASNQTYKLNVVKDTLSDWDSENCIGIQIINVNTCRIEIVQATAFTIGVQCLGAGSGFAYNEVSLGRLISNKIGLDLTTDDPDTDTAPFNNIGWTNENVFLNGRFSVWSSSNLTKSRYGIRITSTDGSYTANNNNLFIKPSFELTLPYEPNEAIPILVEHGMYNKFESCRAEGNSYTFARVQNSSQSNEFHVGYGGGYIDSIDDQSDLKDSTFTLRRNAVVQQPKKLVYSSGPLHKKAGRYNNSGSPYTHVPGLHIGSSGSSNFYVAMLGLTIGDDYLTIASSKAIGGLVDTSKVKRFVFTRQVEEDYEGRMVVHCFDANDLTLADPEIAYVSSSCYYAPGGAWGGAYQTHSDSSRDIYFCVTDEVKKISVMAGGWGTEQRIRSFSLFSIGQGSTSLVPGYSNFQSPFPDANVAITAPTGGTWETGRIFYNAAPGTGEYVGWICTSGGTPGTWLGFGEIE